MSNVANSTPFSSSFFNICSFACSVTHTSHSIIFVLKGMSSFKKSIICDEDNEFTSKICEFELERTESRGCVIEGKATRKISVLYVYRM